MTHKQNERKTLFDLVVETYRSLTDQDLRKLRTLEHKSRILEQKIENCRDELTYKPVDPTIELRERLQDVNRMMRDPQQNSLSLEIHRRQLQEAISIEESRKRENAIEWQRYQKELQEQIKQYTAELQSVNKEIEALLIVIADKNQMPLYSKDKADHLQGPSVDSHNQDGNNSQEFER